MNIDFNHHYVIINKTRQPAAKPVNQIKTKNLNEGDKPWIILLVLTMKST